MPKSPRKSAVKTTSRIKKAQKRLKAQGNKAIDSRERRTANAYLTAVSNVLPEWNSSDDEAAFGDL